MQTQRYSIDSSKTLADWQSVCERICLIVLTSGLLSLAMWLCWTLGRGIELTDEAYYVLNGMHPEAIQFFFTPTQWLSGPLWSATGSLTGFRAIGLLIMTISAAVLAWGTIRASNWVGLPEPKTLVAKGIPLTACICSAWLYGAVLNFAPSYNSLSAAGAYSSVGLLFCALDCPDRRKSMALFMLAGVTLGLTLIAKFSSGICITVLILGLFVVFFRAADLTVRNALAMIIVVPMTVISVAFVFSSPTTAWHAFRNGLELTSLAQQNEPISIRLMRNWLECRTMIETAARAFLGPLLCVGASLLLRHALLGIIAALWFALNLSGGDFLLGGMDRYQVQSVPLAATVLLAMFLTIGVWGRKPRLAILVIALFLLPFLIALGTGNPLPFQIILSMASWGLLCAMLANAVHGPLRLAALLFCLIFVAIVASQIVTSGTRSPYRLSRPLQEQTVTVDIASVGRVRVDMETSKFVKDVQAAATKCQVSAGTPFLGFYNLPGLAIVLGAIPIDTPWLFGEPFASAVLNQTAPFKLQSALVALKLNETGQPPHLPDQLKEFPQKYRACGEAMLPYQRARVELWAPREP